MLTVMISKWVGDTISKGGIYDRLIELNKYPFLYYHEEFDFGMTASEVMTGFEELEVIFAQNTTFASLRELLAESTVSGYPIVRSVTDHTFIGYIGRTEIKMLLGQS